MDVYRGVMHAYTKGKCKEKKNEEAEKLIVCMQG